jgi:hypothetical protein
MMAWINIIVVCCSAKNETAVMFSSFIVSRVMPVRVNIVGDGANKPVDYPDGANTEAVEKKLLGGYGKGIFKQQGIGILSDTLAPSDYEYHLTAQQGQFFRFHSLNSSIA